MWGIWNGVTARDSESLRRTAAILRQFPGLVQGAAWTPHAPVTEAGLVFASRFRDTERGDTLWLLVNRDTEQDVEATLRLDCEAGRGTLVDVYHGQILEDGPCNEAWEVRVGLEAGGYGAVLDAADVDEELLLFLERMAELTSQPLASYSDQWAPLPQTMQEPEPEEVGARSEGGHQLEVVRVPGGRAYNFYTLGNAIEGDRLPEAMDVQFPWETHPQVSRYLQYQH